MTFSDLTNTDKPVLIDFYADWCAPCRAMKPILEDLKSQMGEQVSIFKIDVDKNQTIAERFNVRSIPTLILFKDGEPVWRKSGIASSSELQKAVNQFQPSN
jgi:thioredoxin 1